MIMTTSIASSVAATNDIDAPVGVHGRSIVRCLKATKPRTWRWPRAFKFRETPLMQVLLYRVFAAFRGWSSNGRSRRSRALAFRGGRFRSPLTALSQ